MFEMTGIGFKGCRDNTSEAGGAINRLSIGLAA